MENSKCNLEVIILIDRRYKQDSNNYQRNYSSFINFSLTRIIPSEIDRIYVKNCLRFKRDLKKNIFSYARKFFHQFPNKKNLLITRQSFFKTSHIYFLPRISFDQGELP